MRKIRIIVGLLALLFITGCGVQEEVDRSDVEDKNQAVEDNLDLGTGEEGFEADSITQDQAMNMVYKYATRQIENVEGRKIAINNEEDINLEAYDDVCFVFRVSEETDEQSLVLSFYAIGKYSRIIYQLDPVTGEYVEIGQVDFDGYLSDDQSSENSANDGGQSLDELVAAVQQSKAITMELTHDPSTSMPYPAEDMGYLMNDFVAENLKPIDYTYLFIPDYYVSCDTGVAFYLMQDRSSDNDLTLIQFEGNDTLYASSGTISDDFVRLLSPSSEANMAQMHVFVNDTNVTSCIDTAVRSYGVQITALDYFTNNGYTLASMMEEDIFRVDSYDTIDMSEVDPHLVSVMINYSVKTTSETTSDEWITNNTFVGAIWIDQRDEAARAYILGLEPYMADDTTVSQADMTISIYEKSLAKALME